MSTYLASAATDEKLVLRWQVHLAREQPHKLLVIAAAVGSTAVLSYSWFGTIIPAVVIAFALLGSLSDFLLPVTYTLTTLRASASTAAGKRIMAWKDVKNCYLDEFGVKLSPLPGTSRLEAYRGVYLRFGDRREEVLEAIESLRPKNG